MTGVHTIQLGDVTVTRVWEYYGSVEMTPDVFFTGNPEQVWADNAGWLQPTFLDPATGIVNSAIQTWVLRSAGRTILVDTGVGNHKERPYAQVWAHHDTTFLDNLARAGVRPEEVDVVVNTHLHIDHVGWNTRLDGRTWVPTFPNATYVMPKADFDFWNPENNNPTVFGRGNQNVFEDSVVPVHRAGQTLLWEDTHRLDENLVLTAAPGHTPGSSVLTLTSGTDRALFVGDLMHSPVQVLEPEANSCFCEDPAMAVATRRRLLGWAADHNAIVVPAHFPGGGALEVTRDADRFAIKDWAPFG
ncbi:MBL fold metallo-hydrolase [Actinoplanes sp. NBRC 14428]|uniref:Glyoxylase-like metal-dependent hydrolase (Beta-lactamase superfamily II) n=1 Tax=Pseudosporangium ferrugineum TaxID=439699 RepID=A0A2T0R790_9ACTN|nr:MBL fold metallo-hydrolase [Pseudosporangium ferrugineum]PRY17020.1 glyoxylase-like metal-dependent hydrolase (beta-lactamase superfamily II) [Pseudosporangium ferrugineum]BCJ51281.1 MBL fold metallo-hydrolase [Actinoplanes sp. NBRC 14428]